MPILIALAEDRVLEPRLCNHDLGGDWVVYRDCHVKPDLVLIYRKPDAATPHLVRLGSHSEVFG